MTRWFTKLLGKGDADWPAEAYAAPPGLPAVVVERLPTEFRVSQKREDRPEFKRTYSTSINGHGIKLEVEARTPMFGGRSYSGMLTQWNGRWVFFDPERVADKILDRELVPLIERACTEALAMDKTFMRSKPTEFIDESGTTWRRLA